MKISPFGALATLLVVLAAAPTSASAATLLSETLTARGGTAKGACQASWRPGTPGVATRTVTAPDSGVIEATLDGGNGDWDLAIFNAAGDVVAADASPDAQEVASGYLVGARELRVQACRRTGNARFAQVAVTHTRLVGDGRALRADPPQLVDVLTPTLGDKDRLSALNLDMTEHGGTESLGVVLHGQGDRDKLLRSHLRWRVLVPDLIAASLARGAADERARTRAAGAAAPRVALPSGRTLTYRTLADYNSELKKLADDNKGLVKLIVLPFKTYLGREVMGIEITKNVEANDGKPAFLNMGLHHSREWPAGEHAMEWAYELINGFKARDPRIVSIVEKSRNIVVPVVNPDGFNASRQAGMISGGDIGRPEDADETALIVAGTASGGEYRRKNCRLPDNSEAGNCLTSAGIAESGVDPNRNYGGLWGGPGADPGADAAGMLSQTYRGPAPFSEPETKNIKALVGSRQVTTLITNHTTAGLLLRAPGIASLGDPIDENRGYKALGDAMAKENGYFSQKSFELYDTTGTTEDWTYNTAGGFGFTFEVFCGAPNFETGDCDDPAFHPLYSTMAKEYEGDSDQSNHKTDPGFSEKTPFGTAPNFDGKGNREAYLIAAESTINEARHSVLEGDAPAGVTLRLKKEFKTETFPQRQADGSADKAILFDDKLETTYDVDGSGKFRWHVNPSTRPISAKDRGDKNAGAPSPRRPTTTGDQRGSSETADDPDDGAAVPRGMDPAPLLPVSYNDHPFSIPADGGDNGSANIRVNWGSIATDWDIELFEDTDANNKSNAGDKSIGVSATGPSTEEEVGITGDPKINNGRLVPGKKYVLRVTNFVGAEAYKVNVRYDAPAPFRPATTEAFTMTCEFNGKVLDTQQVVVDRGQVKPVTLGGGCSKAAVAAAAKVEAAAVKACDAKNGFNSVRVTPVGRGARLAFSRKVPNPVTVQVFRLSRGRFVTRELQVAKFRKRTKSFTWNGRPTQKGRKVSNGYFFVRYQIAGTGNRVDVRRVALERRGGRFFRRPDFYRRASCDRLPSYKLERAVFGGITNRPLRIAFTLAQASKATVTIVRGKTVVKQFGPTDFSRGVHRLSLPAKGLKRGEYKVKITVPGFGSTVTSTLTARRL